MDGKTEEWLVNFKNETHNHPTEIEPFGGAATCLGGAIRDPLSGRTYVYQAMRVTGAADPTVSVKDTMNGKLPQKKIVRSRCTWIQFLRKPDRTCDRLCKRNLSSELCCEAYGDRRGYGCGSETCGTAFEFRSGRHHYPAWRSRPDVTVVVGQPVLPKHILQESIDTCGAEVQKGNAPTERKLQRLFRREEVSHIIKKCNDFGAGGVSVAIGELADGLRVQLGQGAEEICRSGWNGNRHFRVPGAYGSRSRIKKM